MSADELQLLLARHRARLLTRLNHDLRTPLARIADRARTNDLAAMAEIGDIARRHLAWIGDLQVCARCEVEAPELTLAPVYLHALVHAHAVRHEPAAVPALAVLDGRHLAQVLDRLAGHTGAPLTLDVVHAVGGVALTFCTGVRMGTVWQDVPATLDSDDLTPGLMLAAHLVRAMGGVLARCGGALRFTIEAALATEDQAMPPTLFGSRFEAPPPFGDGHTMLLREPHDAMRDYLTEIFDSAGFTLCYEFEELAGGLPALVVCGDAADVADGRHGGAPRLLHALLPPSAAQAFDAVLYKPAPPQQLLAVARRLLEDRLLMLETPPETPPETKQEMKPADGHR
jgi:hypothetical protein